MTAGPVSHARPASRVTVSSPPGTVTDQGSHSCPVSVGAAEAAAVAAATAPVPQDLVSPEPRSYTRMATLRGPVSWTSSTFPPSGNCPGSRPGGRDRSNEDGGPSTRQTRCGFPTETRSPSWDRPPTTALPGPRTATRPISTVTTPSPPGPSSRTRRCPDRVATVNSLPSVRPCSARYRANTPIPAEPFPAVPFPPVLFPAAPSTAAPPPAAPSTAAPPPAAPPPAAPLPA